MSNNGDSLKSLVAKIDQLLLAITTNTSEINHVKTQYSTLNVVINHLQSKNLELGTASGTKG